MSNKFISYNIYKNNFIPIQSIKLSSKLLKLTKIYGNLTHTFVSGPIVSPADMSKRKTKYPLISVMDEQIKVNYSKVNYNENNEKKTCNN